MSPGLLQHIGDHRHSGAAHAEHLRQKLVGKFEGIGVDPVARLQQPAAQPRLDRMQGVACGDLLDLDQQHLAIAHEETADGTALLGDLAEARRGDTRG
jgi:hypothetical protein